RGASMQRLVWRTVVALAFGVWAAAAAAQEIKDMHLEDAGFIVRVADTPQKLEQLRKLPARQFIARTKPGGRYFLYADPDFCKCLFVGNQSAMQAFRDMSGTALAQPDKVPASGV